MNFTSSILGCFRSEITDLDELKVSTINSEISPISFVFCVPCIVHDSLKKKDITPQIKVIDPLNSLDFLSECKIILYSVPVSKKETWAKRQRCRYYLREEDFPEDEDSKKVTSFPANHYLEVDIANKKIRLHGSCISPTSDCTDWIYF